MTSISPLPKKFLEKLPDIYPHESIDAIIDSFTKQHPVSLRINTIKTTVAEIKDVCEAHSFHLIPIPWYPNAFMLDEKTSSLTSLQEYLDGKIYIQGLSSMIPSLILDPREEDTVLDIAAAPGSKTTQIAELMNNKGKIFANDISRERLFKLKAVLLQQGVTNVEVMNIAGEKIWQELPNFFDKVLVDAPCSMEGRFSAHSPKSYNHWSSKKVQELSHRQQYLLWSAVSSTKNGGTIVYSTCTISPEENEEVVDWVIKKAEGAVVIEDITLSDTPLTPGLIQYKNKSYDPSLSKTKRIIPQENYEGFYIAKLKKVSK
ncbi:MAG: tRNA (cytosine49-C5)-methyltransferase [Patescibacteria group bacterium]|jgi:16S rRNA (cytosine1407-C5)-methyltransferase|nr:tRNA (cytosine49-C5)-methyltransferase [Patescibacteria group bacterium]